MLRCTSPSSAPGSYVGLSVLLTQVFQFIYRNDNNLPVQIMLPVLASLMAASLFEQLLLLSRLQQYTSVHHVWLRLRKWLVDWSVATFIGAVLTFIGDYVSLVDTMQESVLLSKVLYAVVPLVGLSCAVAAVLLVEQALLLLAGRNGGNRRPQLGAVELGERGAGHRSSSTTSV